MTHDLAIRPRPLLAIVAVLAALAAAAVAAHATAAPAARATVHLRTTALGPILVDARGHSLYLFEADKGPKSTCYGKCATFWPPLITTAAPRAAKGVEASLLGTTKRRHGRLQVTYRGHPLYTFLKDTRAGQTAGENLDFFGGEWYVLSAAGRKVEPHGKSPAPTTTSAATTTAPAATGGGYGYGR
jgi:predicted lipoprotein with Yx(FWY)xxD motif